jgi:hypothetical protein
LAKGPSRSVTLALAINYTLGLMPEAQRFIKG